MKKLTNKNIYQYHRLQGKYARKSNVCLYNSSGQQIFKMPFTIASNSIKYLEKKFQESVQD